MSDEGQLHNCEDNRFPESEKYQKKKNTPITGSMQTEHSGTFKVSTSHPPISTISRGPATTVTTEGID